MKHSCGNFLNGTNNRLESLNAKVKSVISRYSSLEEFVENFFVVIRVLRSEQDHKASLAFQKVPVIYTYSIAFQILPLLVTLHFLLHMPTSI